MKKITTILTLALITGLSWQVSAQNGGADCASAEAVTEGTTTTTILDATPGTNTGDSAWYVYTATGDGTINVNSCSGGADTRLFIWNDCADGAATANNDDAANCPINTDGTGSNFASRIEEFPVTTGEDYFIQWDDRWTVDTPFDWSLTFTPTPTCPAPENFVASEILEMEATFTWDEVTEAADGYILNVFDDGADPETAVAVYTENVPSGTLTATATGLMGTTPYDAYLMANCGADDMSEAELVNFTTNAPLPANDACADAIDITCDSVTAGTTLGATQADQQTDTCGTTPGAPGVWYLFDNSLPEGSTVLFSLCSDATAFDTKIQVYSGDCGALVCVDGNDDSCGLQSEIEITTDASTQYFVYVFGFGSNQGDFELSVTCTPAEIECEAPANVAVSNILDTTADITWDEAPTATAGYLAAVFETGADPANDTPVYSSPAILAPGTTTDSATGLTAEVTYDAYVVSICDLSDPENPVIEFSEAVTFNTILDTPSFDTISFSATPNPTTGLVNIRTNVSIENIEVYNVLGQQVLTRTPNAQDFTLDVTSLQAGTYFVKATANGLTTTHKLIRK